MAHEPGTGYSSKSTSTYPVWQFGRLLLAVIAAGGLTGSNSNKVNDERLTAANNRLNYSQEMRVQDMNRAQNAQEKLVEIIVQNYLQITDSYMASHKALEFVPESGTARGILEDLLKEKLNQLPSLEASIMSSSLSDESRINAVIQLGVQANKIERYLTRIPITPTVKRPSFVPRA